MNTMAEVPVEGSWRVSRSVGEFQAENPATGKLLPERYPVSSRDEMLGPITRWPRGGFANDERGGDRRFP